MMNNILEFPKTESLNETDKQFLELENQAEIIKKQKEAIKIHLNKGPKNV